MALVEHSMEETVALLTMNSGENRFNPDFLNAFLTALDDIENNTDALTLVVRSAHEKIFSNGIDLEYIVPFIQQGDTDTAKAFFYLLNKLLRRIVNYPMVTIASINGHAFAGGAIMSSAFDFRFMRSDRGFFCLPEVDLGIPFLPGMNALLAKAVPHYMLEEMQYTGIRLTAAECEKHHIVKKACNMNDLLSETMTFAKGLQKKRGIVAELKQRLNREILHAIDVEDVPYLESGQFNIT